MVKGSTKEKPRKHHKNIELMADHYFHMANEQSGFVYHHILDMKPDEKADETGVTKTEEELVKTGKYMHRYPNAVKHLDYDIRGPSRQALALMEPEHTPLWHKAGGMNPENE